MLLAGQASGGEGEERIAGGGPATDVSKTGGATPVPDRQPIVDANQRQALIIAAQAKYGKETAIALLHDIIPVMSLPSNTSPIQLLIQLGPDVTANHDIIKSVLVRFGISDTSPPTDSQVVDIFTTLARLASEGHAICDVAVLVRVLCSYPVHLNWPVVIRSFDRPTRVGVDTPTLKLLIAILLNAPGGIKLDSQDHTDDPLPNVTQVSSPSASPYQHAVTGFWSAWSNTLYQLRLLDALLSLPSDTFSFVLLPGRRVVTVEDVATASPTIKSLAANVQGCTWNSLDLFEVLVKAADAIKAEEIRQCIREMLDKAIKISAELVHMGLLQVNVPLPPTTNNASELGRPPSIRQEYSRKLLHMFLNGHPNHQLVFMRLWQINRDYLSRAFREFWEESPLNVTRILDVGQDLKILDALLEVRPFAFALDVAALASRREFLNLDKWLADMVAAHGAEFLHAVIGFLEVKMESERTVRMSDPPVEPRTMALYPNTIAIIMRVLRSSSNNGMMDPADTDYCIEVRNLCLQIHPRLMSLAPGSDAEPGLSVISYPVDIEAEVDGIYKQMYDEALSIDQVIAMLSTHKSSPSTRDHDVFSCILHFLFDEYKFFQSYYPERELGMTADLFGSLIQHQLIDYIPLGIAIRYVLDALNCDEKSNLFRFGVRALGRFESRLEEWKPLCEALLKIPRLVEVRPDLAANIQRILASGDGGTPAPNGTPSDALGGALPHAPAVAPFSVIEPDVLEGDVDPPPEELSDKILFIVNNLAPNNFDAKMKEMKKIIDNGTPGCPAQMRDQHARWFARYLVDQRISSEPNNHPLYFRLMDYLSPLLKSDHDLSSHQSIAPTLHKHILHYTLVKAASLLNSSTIAHAPSERNQLRNIGSWLGTITLARDRPILHRNLRLKELLIEAWVGGMRSRNSTVATAANRLALLSVAIPFTCTTLEPAAQSRVFRPPNPWLMGILSVLVELYLYGELKLKPKFEIERLCGTLGLQLSEIEPSSTVREVEAELLKEEMARGGNQIPGYVSDIDALGPYDGGSEYSAALIFCFCANAHAAPVGALFEPILSALAAHVRVSAQLMPLHANPNFKRVVVMAVDRAVREIIIPVVERSVTIAGISTRELVGKDFATEINEDKIRKASHLMAQKLAGSLALVTCKDPLRTHLISYLKSGLSEYGFGDVLFFLPFYGILLLVSDNLDLACGAIEKAAMERVVPEIEEALASSYEFRRRHKEVGARQVQFWDPNFAVPAFSATIPEVLRVNKNGVLPMQLAVYEDFGLDPRRRISVSRPGSTMAFANANTHPTSYSPAPMPLSQSVVPVDDVLERFNVMIRELDNAMLQLPISSLQLLPADAEIRLLVQDIATLQIDPGDRPRVPLVMSQKIVQYLYKAPTQLGREVYCAILESLCRRFDDVGKEAINWLTYAEDERKYNAPVTDTLLRAKLVNVVAQDEQLAKVIAVNPRPSLLRYAVDLINDYHPKENAAPTDYFPHTIAALADVLQQGKGNDEVKALLDGIQGVITPARAPSTTPSSSDELPREKLLLWFQQWVNICARTLSPDKQFVMFIKQPGLQGVLTKYEASSMFFRVCAESSVEHYMTCAATASSEGMTSAEKDNAYMALDSMSKLMALIIKYHGDPNGVTTDHDQAKIHYLTKIMSIVVLVLSSHHEDAAVEFPHMSFYRFFSSLLNELHGFEQFLGSAYIQLLIAMSDTFSSLQPLYFPRFAFSWMGLICHRFFMPKLLMSEHREGWSAFHTLLLSLFTFLSPFLKEGDLRPSSKRLYLATLRLLLVLLHDFPEFLSQYYFSLCDAIPPRSLQLRNIILSAFPPSLVLPDPHLPIQFESYPEISIIPSVLSDYTNTFKNSDLRNHLEQYLMGGGNPTLHAALQDALHFPSATDGVPGPSSLSLMNSIVMFVGFTSVRNAKLRGGPLFVASDPGVVLLQYLFSEFDVDGQFHLLGAMTMHLRYPNAHTQWFSALILHLFKDVNDERCREMITRALLERFIVHRPHPWGALMTFIELMRNSKYDFWNREFINVSPDVTVLLKKVCFSFFRVNAS
ncbi:Not1-domain-containing protein [Fistulina hepatica ATCC 64428]|nr:Not1-domain-containing protein [Fistulina hepatica ATCC 64428]